MSSKPIKCPICKKKYVALESVYEHIESVHGDEIPKHIETGARYYYFLKTGKESGKCRVCGNETKWNMKTNRYSVLCGNPKCKETERRKFEKNMIAKYNKTTLLKDPEHQRKMLSNRSISGKYTFEDGTKFPYTGSYEKDFLQFMDLFMKWDPNDIISPSPFNYVYNYNNDEHFYIPDFYIPSLDLNIEVKDGGKNPNMHHKIQNVDKVKEAKKDEVMLTSKRSYIKIYDKDYGNFMRFLNARRDAYVNDKDIFEPLYFIEDYGKLVKLQEDTGILPHPALMTFYKNYTFHYNSTKKYIDDNMKQIKTENDTKELLSTLDAMEGIVKYQMRGDKDGAYDYEGEKILKYIEDKRRILNHDLRYSVRESSEKPIMSKIYTPETVHEVNEITCPDGFYFEFEKGDPESIRWNAIKWINGEPWRDAVETMVFKGDKVFLLEKNREGEDYYRMPGGSKEPSVPDIKQAENEINEEAKLTVKWVKGPLSTRTYTYKPGTKWTKKLAPFNYKGKIMDIYMAKYDGKYNKPVAKVDRHESMANYGKFMNITDVYDNLKPQHKLVVDAYLNNSEKISVVDSGEVEIIANEATTTDDTKIMYVILFNNNALTSKFIKRVTNQPYSHAAISLNTTMNDCYSFGNIPFSKKNGFVRESIYSPAYIINEFFDVFVMRIPGKKYKKLNNIINNMDSNQSIYDYNLVGLLGYYFNIKKTERLNLSQKSKYFCSEFVSYILNEVRPDKNLQNTLVSPGDIVEIEKNLILVGRYNIESFSQDKLNRDVEKALKGMKTITEANALNFVKHIISSYHQKVSMKWEDPIIGQFSYRLDWKRIKDEYEKIIVGDKDSCDRFDLVEFILRKAVIPRYIKDRTNMKVPNKDYTDDIVDWFKQIHEFVAINKMKYFKTTDPSIDGKIIAMKLRIERTIDIINGKIKLL